MPNTYMETEDLIREIASCAEQTLEGDVQYMFCLLEKAKHESSLMLFVNRSLKLFNEDPNMFYRFFHNVVSCNPRMVLDRFHNFVSSCLDDGYFGIEWLISDYDLQQQSRDEVLSFKENPNTFPEVVWAKNSKNSSQDFRLLLEAMDILEQREQKRNSDIEKDQQEGNPTECPGFHGEFGDQ